MKKSTDMPREVKGASVIDVPLSLRDFRAEIDGCKHEIIKDVE